MSDVWPWLALGLLGAYHGLNPGMGWLFAVALGLQERSRKAVLLALPPIALGHEVSVALAALLVSGVGLVAAPESLRPVGAAALILFGLYRFLGARAHPRWVGMRVSPRELVLWSFLVSSAHGAGLMLFPVLLGLPAVSPAHESPKIALGATAAVQGAAAATVHALAMLLTMGAVAILVYEKLGLVVLRRAWLNLDALWAAALVAAGIVTLLT
jgi:hypothetical protein